MKIYNLNCYYHQDTDKFSIKLHGYNNGNIDVVNFNLFKCLLDLRKILEQDNVITLCSGAKMNLWAGGMTSSMGSGLFVYELTKGEAASNTVNIFEEANPDEVVKVKDQELFYLEWLSSIQS